MFSVKSVTIQRTSEFRDESNGWFLVKVDKVFYLQKKVSDPAELFQLLKSRRNKIITIEFADGVIDTSDVDSLPPPPPDSYLNGGQ